MNKQTDISGKDHYDAIYIRELELEGEWLRLSAPEKVNSIEYLLGSSAEKCNAMLELGCGTGAVVQECQRRNLCDKYVAVDYSREAIEYLQKNSSSIDTVIGDITTEDFYIEGTFDLVVLSHVLEHLEKPELFLDSVYERLNFERIIIEVPLECLAIRRIRDIFRDRNANASGHVQFFTVKSFEKLLSEHGFMIKARHMYLPILDLSTQRFVSRKNGLSRFQSLVKVVTNIFIPRLLYPFWKRLYYAHYAVLCVKNKGQQVR